MKAQRTCSKRSLGNTTWSLPPASLGSPRKQRLGKGQMNHRVGDRPPRSTFEYLDEARRESQNGNQKTRQTFSHAQSGGFHSYLESSLEGVSLFFFRIQAEKDKKKKKKLSPFRKQMFAPLARCESVFITICATLSFFSFCQWDVRSSRATMDDMLPSRSRNRALSSGMTNCRGTGPPRDLRTTTELRLTLTEPLMLELVKEK